MTTPTSRAAYKPYYEVLDRALESEAGLRIKCDEKGDAYQYRVRINTAKAIDRNLNRLAREPDDPKYGQSDYDSLIVRIKEEEGAWWVYIEPNTLNNEIEELSA